MAVLSDSASGSDEVAAALERVVATEWGRILGSVIASVRDWELAEDAVQDALATAVRMWGSDGIPRNPAAWITRAARNRAIDILRREATRSRAAQELGAEFERGVHDTDTAVEPDDFPADDERLRLVFTCCHPALPMEARVALTLRTVLGLTPAELARAFLTTEAAMEKRLVRARAKIAHAGIPYRIPSAELLHERTAGVLAVLYLLFTEGYSASSGDSVQRRALAEEAIRLARIVRELLPDGTSERIELDGLLALMLIQHARRDAREAPDGTPRTIAEQDRSTWDLGAIAEAEALVEGAATRASHRRIAVGPYLLQAAIAYETVRGDSVEHTDHTRIAELYTVLARVAPSPVVDLNRAIAVAAAEGPDAGLAILDRVADELDGNHLLHAARAELLARQGRASDAAAAWARAADLAPTDAERRVLRSRAESVGH